MQTLEGGEHVSSSPRVLLITGGLGSGKTSLLNLLVRTSRSVLGQVGLIVNDIGDKNIDATRLPGENLVALSDGCVCCDDISSLKEAVLDMQAKVDTLLIEPTGIADAREIKKFLAAQHLETRVLTLIPEAHLSRILHSSYMRPILESQIAAADVLGVTRPVYPDFEELRRELSVLRTHGLPMVHVPFAPQFSGEFLGDTDHITQEVRGLLEILFASTVSSLSLPMCTHHCAEDHASHHHHHHHHHHEHHHEHADIEKADIRHNLNKEALQKLLEADKRLVRAKGVVATEQGNRHFDFAMGTFDLKEQTTLQPFMTLIAEPGYDWRPVMEISLGKFSVEEGEEGRSALEKSRTPLTQYPEMDDDALLQNAQIRTKELIQLYQEYAALEALKNQLVAGEKTEENTFHIQETEAAMKDLGDSMTFEDPLIWIMYKHHAYLQTPDALHTLSDLRAHCFKRPDYICGKRFRFLHAALQDGEFAEDMPLEEFYNHPALREAMRGEGFMETWQRNEFYEEGGYVRKWQNVSVS